MKEHQKNLLQILAILLVTHTLFSTVISNYKAKFGDNISSFICIGTHFMKPDEMPETMFYFEESRGYDGQFFYFIARDPFITGNMHQYLDVASYRYQRIIYPLLANISAFGDSERIPKALVQVNLSAILLGTIFAALMLIRQNMSPFYSLFYPVMNGLLLALLRDLSAPTAMALTMGGFYFYSRGNFIRSSAFMAAAILSREIIAVMVLIMIADSLIIKRKIQPAIIISLALLPFSLWLIYISLKLHTPPWRGGQGNFGMPFSAMTAHLQEIISTPGKLWQEKTLLLMFVTTIVISPGLAIRETFKARNEVSLSFLAYALLPFFMSARVWIEPWSYCRVLLPVSILLLLSFIKTKNRIYLIPLSIHALLFPITLAWLFA